MWPHNYKLVLFIKKKKRIPYIYMYCPLLALYLKQPKPFAAFQGNSV